MTSQDKLDTLHAEEERLRGEHKKLLALREDLREHINLIRESMNIIAALTKEHAHRTPDELTMQFLGIRLFNAAAASIKLAYSGYYQNAFSALRDFLETYFLVDFLYSNPKEITSWKKATKEELKGRFGPNAIRNALDKRDGFKEGKRKLIYDLISQFATHATPGGFRMTLKGKWGELGPFYEEDRFEAWVQEAVKMASHAGIVFASGFNGVDENLLLLKAQFLGDLNAWKKKYFGGPDVWEDIK